MTNPVSSPVSTTITPSDAAPPPSATRYPLGWLRGLAALAVVVFHAYQFNRVLPTWEWPWSGSLHQVMTGTDLFVDMFFVLSGLVLWGPVVRALADGLPTRSGRMILYRRMARLLPLYYAVVLVVWALTNPTLPGHWADLFLHLTFSHVYSDTYIFWTNGPAWSLAVEFHFYVAMALAVPLVAAATRRVRGRGGRLAMTAVLPLVFIAITAGYLAWAMTQGYPHTDWSIWFSPLSKAADFGIGMLLAVLINTGLRLGRAPRATLALLGVGGTLVLVMVRPLTVVGELWHPAYSLTIALGLASVVLHDGPWPRALDWKPMAWVGGLGYGVYLIHEPVMRMLSDWGVLPDPRRGAFFLVTAVLVAVPSIALAWLSSRTLEAAGARVLRTMTADGSPRDYYAHLTEAEHAEGRRPQLV